MADRRSAGLTMLGDPDAEVCVDEFCVIPGSALAPTPAAEHVEASDVAKL